jgi:hypothetical protein
MAIGRTNGVPPVNDGKEKSFDVLWGGNAIGKALGVNRKKVYRLFEAGQLRGVKKMGRELVGTRQGLASNFEAAE